MTYSSPNKLSKIHREWLLRSEEIFSACAPAIFRIVWEETPENLESKIAIAGYFNLDFDRDDFEELSRGYVHSRFCCSTYCASVVVVWPATTVFLSKRLRCERRSSGTRD